MVSIDKSGDLLHHITLDRTGDTRRLRRGDAGLRLFQILPSHQKAGAVRVVRIRNHPACDRKRLSPPVDRKRVAVPCGIRGEMEREPDAFRLRRLKRTDAAPMGFVRTPKSFASVFSSPVDFDLPLAFDRQKRV